LLNFQLTFLLYNNRAILETEIIKCGLPEAKRPTEEENKTDIEDCIKKLEQNDETLKDINLNNMKVDDH